MRRRSLDPYSGRPLYRQLADHIRDAILAGELRPGERLPSEGRLAGDYELGVDAVRDALAVLRGEGLIVTLRGRGSRVREALEAVLVMVPPGARISCRMPTEEERKRFGLPEGTPVLVVQRPDGVQDVYPGDRTVAETTDAADE